MTANNPSAIATVLGIAAGLFSGLIGIGGGVIMGDPDAVREVKPRFPSRSGFS